VSSVDCPVNVLLLPGGPTPSELAGAGVARISVGSAFQNVMFAALARAGSQLLAGSTEWSELAVEGRKAVTGAFA
jgi:2-methylisocitrate lyase-like PEP mutase family enzyme